MRNGDGGGGGDSYVGSLAFFDYGRLGHAEGARNTDAVLATIVEWSEAVGTGGEAF